MFVKQFFVKGLAHSSYLLGGSTTCAIVDPRRDIDIYLKIAEEMNMKITHILETHLHADFVSGHMDLAKVTGAKIYVPESADCKFEHIAVADGDSFEIEDMKIEVLETPGHTPEHISYVVTDKSRGAEPACLFCGDTLFVGDVGRPDLFPGMAQELAGKLFSSLHDKLLKLPDFCAVYPAHGAGSLCGRAMGAMRTTTIGYERKYNQALQIKDKGEFVKSLTTNMPAAPDHFSRCSAINGAGPALTSTLSEIKKMKPLEFKRIMENPDVIVLDIRSYDAFGGQHIPGAYHIDITGNFATFAGWIIPPDKEIYLVAFSEKDVYEADLWLKRVGLDNVKGFLDGGMFNWSKNGLPTAHVNQLSVKELCVLMNNDEKFTFVDVRSPGEFAANHIEGACNIPAPEIRTRFKELDKANDIILSCATGHRSSMASSILQQHGFNNLFNLAGGMTAYMAYNDGLSKEFCLS